MAPYTVFVSYCRADKQALKLFMPFKTTLEEEKLIEVWSDDTIKPGEQWRPAIERALAKSKTAILFISQNFLASSFVRENELPPILAACEAGRLTVLPVFLSPSMVNDVGIPFVHPDTDESATIKLTAFQGFSSLDKTLEEMRSVEKKRVFLHLAKRIRELAGQEEPEMKTAGAKRSAPVPVGKQVAASAEALPQREEGWALPAHPPAPPVDDADSNRTAEKSEKPGTESFRRTDREIRYRKLEGWVAAAIQASGAVMDLLEKKLPHPVHGKRAGKVDAQERAMGLTKGLMALSFEFGQRVLLDMYEQMEADFDQNGVNAIKKISRLLIPWLYVASQKMEIDQWENGLLGEIRTIPAGIMAFAEIVLAGIDNREIEWKEFSDPLCFPQGSYSVNIIQPEGGFKESTENNLREDLFKTVKSPVEAIYKGEAGKDDAIARRIQWLFKKGIRVYLIGWIPSGEAGDRYKEQLERIKVRYPVLAVVTLNADLMGEHQTLFDDIRSLLL